MTKGDVGTGYEVPASYQILGDVGTRYEVPGTRILGNVGTGHLGVNKGEMARAWIGEGG